MMITRIASIGLILCLAACGGSDDADAEVEGARPVIVDTYEQTTDKARDVKDAALEADQRRREQLEEDGG